jgi:hypothetical protein
LCLKSWRDKRKGGKGHKHKNRGNNQNKNSQGNQNNLSVNLPMYHANSNQGLDMPAMENGSNFVNGYQQQGNVRKPNNWYKFFSCCANRDTFDGQQQPAILQNPQTNIYPQNANPKFQTNQYLDQQNLDKSLFMNNQTGPNQQYVDSSVYNFYGKQLNHENIQIISSSAEEFTVNGHKNSISNYGSEMGKNIAMISTTNENFLQTPQTRLGYENNGLSGEPKNSVTITSGSYDSTYGDTNSSNAIYHKKIGSNSDQPEKKPEGMS